MPQKIRILYIEDTMALGVLFKRVVMRLGYDVDVATTGAAGLSLYDADPHDIVFLDYILPDTDGISLAKKILLDDPEKLIVLATGEGSERLASEAMSTGVSDYIVKDSEKIFVELIPSIITKLVRTLDKRRYKKETEQRYQALLDEMIDAAIVHTDLIIVYVNKVACEIYGASSPDQLIGRSILDMVSDAEMSGQLDRISSVTRDEYLPPIDLMARKLDGRIFPVEARAKAIIWEGADSVIGVLRDLTKQKQTASKLAESEEKHRTLIDGSIQGIIIHRDDEILFANNSAARIHGYSDPKEIVRIVKLSALLSQHERTRMESRRHDRLAGKQVPSFAEYDGLHKDGHILRMESHGQIVVWEGEPAFQSTLIDVTDREKAKSLNELLASAIDNLDVLISLYDENDRLVLANKKAVALNVESSIELEFGKTFEEMLENVVEQNLIDIRPKTPAEWIKDRMFSRHNPTGPLEQSLSNGKTHLIYDQRLPNGATMSVAVEITELKQLEESLRQSQRMETVGQLTGGVAHDFNNLLQVFNGAGTMIDSLRNDPDKLDPWIDSIYKAVNRGKSLTGQLLSFSRQQTLTPEIASPRDAIFKVEELLRRTLGEDIQFKVSSPDDIPLVYIDVHGLQNAVVNLCINAAAAMQNGGSLAINMELVTLEVPVFDNQESPEAGDYVEIAVSDTGTGMEAKIVSKAFDPFFTTKAVDEGTGLGLSMVYGFAKQSGGDASIESEVGKGTTVRLLLPVSIAEVEEKIERPEPYSETRSSASILVVEDDPDVRETTSAILEAIGHQVTSASDAKSALEILQRDNSFDVVISDIVMPGGMSGIELAEKVASLPNSPKVLLTSGYPDRLKEFEGKSLDAIDFLAKPFSMTGIEAAVNAMLQAE